MHKPLSLRLKIIFSWIVYMPVVGISFIIAWLDRILRLPMPFPRDLDQLKTRKPWLVAELKRNGVLPADADILSCDITPLNQSIIFRSNAGIVDIHYKSAGNTHSLKCFAKFAPTMGSIWNRTIFNLQMNHLKEAWFNEYFIKTDTGIPAPKVYCSKVGPLTGNLCLITEHMGDDIEYHDYPYRDLSQAHIDMAMDGMAALHAKYWGDTSPRMAKVLPIEDSTVHLFDSMVCGTWSVPMRRVLLHSWCLMNKPQTVLHGDSRIGNMMFPSAQGRGRFVLIDWQATRRGVAAFDLAYFLVLSLMTTHRHELEQPAIDTYYRSLRSYGVKDYSRKDLERDYRHGCLCTLVLLSLPMLSGEVSAEGNAALLFVFGMGIWRERLRQYFLDFDYAWMAAEYGLTEPESRDAIAGMIAVIDARLNGVLRTAGSHETITDVLRRSNVAGEFDV